MATYPPLFDEPLAILLADRPVYFPAMVDAEEVAKKLGYTVISWKFAPEVHAVRFGEYIGVNEKLVAEDRQQAIAELL